MGFLTRSSGGGSSELGEWGECHFRGRDIIQGITWAPHSGLRQRVWKLWTQVFLGKGKCNTIVEFGGDIHSLRLMLCMHLFLFRSTLDILNANDRLCSLYAMRCSLS